MGRMVVLLVMGVSILFSMSSYRMSNVSLSTLENATQKLDNSNAHNIATSGIELSIMQLDSNKYWRTGYNNFAISGGLLNVNVTSIDSQNVRVRSTGYSQGSSKLIVASLYFPVDNSVLPPAFMPASMCAQNITMSGSSSIVPYNPEGEVNANIHANQSISMSGNANVMGYLTYVNSFTPNPISEVTDFITPNYVIPGKPLYEQASAISKPVLDVNAERNKPGTVVLSDGNYNLTGNLNMGTASNPARYWVGGNLTLDVQMTGYGIIFVGGTVTMNGESEANYPPPANVNNLAIYANGSITLSSEAKLSAQVLTNGSITISGQSILIGNVIANNALTLSGGGTIKFLPANAALTSAVWPGPAKRPELTSYWE